MKKSLYAVIVILLSLIGAKTLASHIDQNIHRVSIETSDTNGTTNGSGDSSGHNRITREK